MNHQRYSRPGWFLATAFLVALATSCGSTTSNVPPQAPAHLSGPDIDTSVLENAPEPSRDAVLHIIHSNDLHGQVHPRRGTWIDKDNPPLVGGFHAMAAYVAQVRAREGEDNVLLLDAGDIYAGTPEGNLTKGQMIAELMNAMSYDAMALGNHEFDMGLDVLMGIKNTMTFPILASNVFPKQNPAGQKAADAILPLSIIERGGVRIGIIGLSSPETPLMTDPAAGEAFDFGDPLTAVRDAVGTLKAEGVQVILVLSHIGKEGEEVLADEVPGDVTAILGGHSHTAIDPAYVSPATGVVYVQTRGKAGALYHLTVKVEDGAAKVTDTRLVPLMAADWSPQPAVTAVLNKYSPDIEKVMGEVVGKCKEGMKRNRAIKSSSLGNFITDVMRKQSKADIAITNKTGLRGNLPATDAVSFRDMYQISPFGNTIVTMSLTGAQLKQLLDNALTKSHTRLEVSGAYVWYDTGKPVGQRVTQMKIGGKAVKDDKMYTVATNSFLAEGGDGHVVFKAGKKRKDTGIRTRDASADWFRANKTCVFDGSPRIRSQDD